MSAGLAYDLAHLIGGGVLLASFLLLYQRRMSALAGVLAAQGALVALAALWQGLVRGEAHLFATAAIAFAAQGVLVPLLLQRVVARLGLDRAVETALPVGASLAAGVALVVLSVLVMLPATAGQAGALARVDMVLALSVLLLGVLMMATRRTAIPQVAGLIAVENGLLLGAVGIAGLPLLLELSIAALVLVLVLVGGVFALLMRARLDSLDVTLLGRHRGEGG
ncbi:MAG: hydrogenase-4 component E [Acetobacteraceae bacterium]|nr:hydrogenase-4 component E [Acetobacteraceae bacterium]